MKRDHFTAQHPNHASDLMRPPFSQNERRLPGAIQFESCRARRSVFAFQSKARPATSDGVRGEFARVFDAIPLRNLARGMGQAMDEVAIHREDDEP